MSEAKADGSTGVLLPQPPGLAAGWPRQGQVQGRTGLAAAPPPPKGHVWPEGSQPGGGQAQGGWETLPVARPQPLSGSSCPCLPLGKGEPLGAPLPRTRRASAVLVGGTAALSVLPGSLQPEWLGEEGP